MDIELGQLCINDVTFMQPEYGFEAPDSAKCLRTCKLNGNEYRPDTCCQKGLACLGWDESLGVRQLWDEVDYVPALLSVCSQMKMPKEELQKLFLQIRGMSQDDACASIRKEVSWERLVSCASGDRELRLRSDAEMTAIQAMAGRLAAFAPLTIEDFQKVVCNLRRQARGPRRGGAVDEHSDALVEEAFSCTWSSRVWNAARLASSGPHRVRYVVECPKSGTVRSREARRREVQIMAEHEGDSDAYLFHPYFRTDFVFVVDWDMADDHVLCDGRSEYLAVVWDPDTDETRLCVACLGQHRGFVNWVCVDTLAHLDKEAMWCEG